MQPCLQPITKPNTTTVAYKFHNKPGGNSRIILDDSQWPTSTINDYIAKIILGEYMGFEVEFALSGGLDSWQPISEGRVHANLEIWPSEQEKVYRQKYITEEHLVADLGALGVVARNGWYIPTGFAREYIDLQSYLGLQRNTAAMDLLKYTRTNYTLNASLERGFFIGPPEIWAPTRAEEQIARNLNIPLDVYYSSDYLGYLNLMLDCLLRRSGHSGRCIMYNYFPSTIKSGYNISRIGLPEYTEACYSRSRQGGIDCDYEYFILNKIAWAGLSSYAPDAYEVLQKFTLSEGQQDVMLQSYGRLHNYDIACEWVRDNRQIWSNWVPAGFAEDPPTPAEEGSTWLYPLLVALAAFTGVLLLGLALLWIVNNFLQKRKLQLRAQRELERQLEECKCRLASLMHPMFLVRADRLASLDRLAPHEELRNRHMLKTIDTLPGLVVFTEENVIVFFSHQWLTEEHPDPHGVHLRTMVRSLELLAAESEQPMSRVWAWIDYCGVPRENRALQRLTVDALIAYAWHSTYFVVVAPSTAGHGGARLNLETYGERLWCRAEQFGRLCLRGSTGMYFADENGILSGPERMGEEGWRRHLGRVAQVFDGQCSCCATGHATSVRDRGGAACDREVLVLPIMALLGIMRYRLTGDENASMSLMDALDEPTRTMVTQLRSPVQGLFPKTHSIVTPDGKQSRTLFGRLEGFVCQDVDSDKQSWKLLQEALIGMEVADVDLRASQRPTSLSSGSKSSKNLSADGNKTVVVSL